MTLSLVRLFGSLFGWRLGLALALGLSLAACADKPKEPRPPDPVVQRWLEPRPASPYSPTGSSTASAEAPTTRAEKPRAEFFGGTGAALGARRTSSESAVPEGDISLNFVNADVREVVRAVLGDILKVPYAIDPRAQSNLTLQTSHPVTRKAALSVLEDALRLSGLALVQAQGVFNVVPVAEALRFAPAIGRGAGGAEGYGVQAIPLRFTSAEEMQRILKSVLPADTMLRALPSHNVLIVAGSQREIASVNDLVAVFDIDVMKGMSFALFHLRNADVKLLTKELDVIFGSEWTAGAGLIRFLPIERLNAVLAASRIPGHLHEAAAWVERLDQGSLAVDERVFVYYVQNGRATDLAATLNALFRPRITERPATAAEGARTPTRRDVPAIPGVPMPTPTPAPTDDSGLRATPAPSLAPDQGIRLSGAAAPRIIADDSNNALLILTTPRDYRMIEAALAKLDLAPLQVLIEAVVAEVTLTNELRYGLQWFFRTGSQSFTLSEVTAGTVSGKFPGFAAVLGTASNIRVVLSALESITKVNVLSSPQMMVLNNQTATLQVGDQVPIATQSATSVLAAGAPVVNTIQFRDTGVILKVTPRVNEGGLVLMEISQEVSDVTKTTTSGIDSPTIQQRKFASTVSVQNGETIALGGLIRDRHTVGDSGIPVLKDLPLLGNAFKATSDTDTRTELVVLFTPRVVRTTVDIRGVTEEFRERMRALTQPVDR